MLNLDGKIREYMTDKFAEYYNTPEKIKELSEYVNLNFRLIWTKMLSEMRRKLDIKPNLENSEGYISLMMSLEGRLFNEMVYSLAGSCQSNKMKITEIIPPMTFLILFDFIEGKNPLNGKLRKDICSQEKFNEYYLEHINALREIVEALPK